jgi:hypothetical protein
MNANESSISLKFPFEMSFLNLEKFILRTFNNVKMKYDNGHFIEEDWGEASQLDMF